MRPEPRLAPVGLEPLSFTANPRCPLVSGLPARPAYASRLGSATGKPESKMVVLQGWGESRHGPCVLHCQVAGVWHWAC